MTPLNASFPLSCATAGESEGLVDSLGCWNTRQTLALAPGMLPQPNGFALSLAW